MDLKYTFRIISLVLKKKETKQQKDQKGQLEVITCKLDKMVNSYSKLGISSHKIIDISIPWIL